MKALAEKTSEKVVRNSIFGVARYLITVPISFFLVPFIIGHVGLFYFGVWALVSSFSYYVSMLNFGVGNALAKYVAEYYAVKKFKEINEALNTSLLVFILIAAAFSFIGIILSAWIIEVFFHASPDISNELVFILIISIISTALGFVFSLFASVLTGLQRIDTISKVAVSIMVLNAIGTVIVLSLGYGIKGLVINNFFITLYAVSAFFLLARKNLPSLVINPLMFTKKTFKKIFSFSLQMHLFNLFDAIQNQLDKLLLAFFSSVTFVSFYEIAFKISTHIRMIPAIIVNPLMPAASELFSLKNKKGIENLYYRSMKYSIVCAMPLFFVFFSLMDQTLFFWVGEGFEIAATIFYVLGIGYFVGLLNAPALYILDGVGKPKYGMITSFISMTVNLSFSVILFLSIGFIGIVIATTLGFITSTVLLNIFFHRFMKLGYGNLFRILLPPFFLSILLAAGVFFLEGFLPVNLLIFISLFGVFFALYSILIWFSGYLNKEDKDLFKRYLNALIRKIQLK